MTPGQHPTLLLAGGSFADIPMIRGAQSLGFRVISSGNRPDEAGHTQADQYCPGDFSDAEAMLDIARANRVSAVCPSCNDFSALSCAIVAEQLGLPGHDDPETAQTIHLKDRFREYVTRTRLPSPISRSFQEPQEAIAFTQSVDMPLIVKPVDLTGGKGVTRLDKGSDAEMAVAQAFDISRAKRVVVEEFVIGSNHGFTCFLRAGRVVFHFADDEYYFLNRYLVSGASTPGSVSPKATARLIEIAEFMADDLGLVDGIFHVQFILRSDSPIIIEICRRPPGDLYVHFVQLATQLRYPELIVRGFAGLDTESFSHADPNGFYTRHCIMSECPGVVSDLTIDDAVRPLILESCIWWKPGMVIKNHLVEKLGIVFLKFPDRKSMHKLSADMQQLIRPTFQDFQPE